MKTKLIRASIIIMAGILAVYLYYERPWIIKKLSFNLPNNYKQIDTFKGGSFFCLDSCPSLDRTYLSSDSQDKAKTELINLMSAKGFNLSKDYTQQILGEGDWSQNVLDFSNAKNTKITITLSNSIYDVPKNKREELPEVFTAIRVIN